MGARGGVTFGGPTLLGRIGGPGAGDDLTTRSTIEIRERFSDFKVVDGLTLPHRYQITLNVDANSGFVGRWAMKIDRMVHDQRIGAWAFAIR